jgi:cytochrome c-type biogenesis protein CcmH
VIPFLVSAVGLVALALLLLLRPFARGDDDADAAPTARDVHRRLGRDQLEELRRDRAAGVIGADEADAAEIELKRRLLEDVAAEAAVPADAPIAPGEAARAVPAAASSRATAWALALALPLLGALGYAWRGHPEVFSPAASTAAGSQAAAAASAASGPVTAERIEAMVERLAARLREHPDDPEGWTRLARARRVMGRAAEARDAYEHVGPALQQDATMLAEYANTIAAMNGGRLDADASKALRRALALDQDNALALSLAAAAAFNAKDMDEAARQWTHLLKVLPPDSRDAATVRAYLAQAARAATGASAASGPRR